jgi:dolichol-phosphate mannosyltransferase
MDGARHSTPHDRGLARSSFNTQRRPASAPHRRVGAGTVARTRVALVVPTRDEAAHVERFVERVDAALAPFPINWHAEVIDDSHDGTASILRDLASRGKPLELTHRDAASQVGGIGGATRAGLIRARGEIVCVIDADLQHPPEILPELLAPIILGRADICIGSRYQRGGSAAGLESRWRQLAARASGAAVRWLFPATRLTTDPGSGLFAMRRKVLDSVTLRPRGSRVLAEILVRARWRTVCDVPYRFEVGEDGGAQLGTSAAFSLARELISLWRFNIGRVAPSEHRSGPLGLNGLGDHRRVAPVHVELLRESTAAEDAGEEPVSSAELT